MFELSSFTAYHDIRELCDEAVFRKTMAYVAWHNTLPMTHLLELWQAIVVMYFIRTQHLDVDAYLDVKDFLLLDGRQTPSTLAECELLATQLAGYLSSTT